MNVGIIGGSGYTGGELLRILIQHPEVDVKVATSRRFANEYVFRVNPNLRGFTDLKFSPLDLDSFTKECDISFIALPHGNSASVVPKLLDTGLKIIDLGGDFRLKDKDDYVRWYGWEHPCPDLLSKATYGLPEFHREEIKNANLVACGGCMSTASILGLAPVVKEQLIETNRIVVDVKIGSSGGGATPTQASHHPERFSGVRSYKPVGHRHTAEIEQELNTLSINPISIAFSPHSVNIVRGILSTMYAFTKKEVETSQLWKTFRSLYDSEPFIRLIRDKKGLYRYPDPKNTIGTNFCDIGFDYEARINRLVIFAAIDNLTKGAASQAIQCLNIMMSIDEQTGLKVSSMHPL